MLSSHFDGRMQDESRDFRNCGQLAQWGFRPAGVIFVGGVPTHPARVAEGYWQYKSEDELKTERLGTEKCRIGERNTEIFPVRTGSKYAPEPNLFFIFLSQIFMSFLSVSLANSYLRDARR